MHSHTKETKEKKITFSPKKYMQHPSGAAVATAGACLPVLAPCALRAAGCAAGLSAGLGPSHRRLSPARGHSSPVDEGVGHFPAAQ